MKIGALLVISLLFAACATTEKSAPVAEEIQEAVVEEPAATETASPVPAEIPVMVRMSVFTKDGSLDAYTVYAFDPDSLLVQRADKYTPRDELIETVEYRYEEEDFTESVSKKVSKSTPDAAKRVVQRIVKDAGGIVASYRTYGYGEFGPASELCRHTMPTRTKAAVSPESRYSILPVRLISTSNLNIVMRD